MKRLLQIALLSLGLLLAPVSTGLHSFGGASAWASDLAGTAMSSAEWDSFKTRFMTRNGRVVDTGNQGVSHSEGQAYGMLFAVANRDRTSFVKLWSWTQNYLAVRDDALHAWRWVAGAPDDFGKEGVWSPDLADGTTPDMNAASDGELLLAWALLEADQDLAECRLLEDANAILKDVKAKLITEVAGRTVLRPGPEGFPTDDGVILNLSYWVFPAIQEIARHDPDPIWKKLEVSGLELLSVARFGVWKLPANWILLHSDGAIEPAEGWEPSFGYDVIRVPLNILWGGYRSKAMLDPYVNYALSFNSVNQIPAVVNLMSGEFSPETANKGMRSIWALLLQQPIPNGTHLNEDYYSTSLRLMAKLAYQKEQRRQ